MSYPGCGGGGSVTGLEGVEMSSCSPTVVTEVSHLVDVEAVQSRPQT